MSSGETMDLTAGEKEKKSAATNSVVAAVFLTGMKLVVGLVTGSLGILAEAAHSALDLVAAVITFLAVHFSDKPADHEHPYGHGKIENFSALIETVLLFATCAWIIYEAVQRLFFHTRRSTPASGPSWSWPFPSPWTSAARGCFTGPPANTTARPSKPTPSTSIRTSGARRSSSAASPWSGWARTSSPERRRSWPGRTPWRPWASRSSSSSSATGSARGPSTSSSTRRPTASPRRSPAPPAGSRA